MKAATLFGRLAKGYSFEYKAFDEVYCDVRFVVQMMYEGTLVIKTYIRDEQDLLFYPIEKWYIVGGTSRDLSSYMLNQLAEHGHDKHVIDWDGFKQF